MDNNALRKIPYGLFVLTAKNETKMNGCIINTAMQVANEPLSISISVNKANYTHDIIKETKAFNVSVISENATFSLFKLFGFQSGRTTDKFDSFSSWLTAKNGIPFITEGTNAYFSVKVTGSVDFDSHTVFYGTVTDMEVLSDVKSATYDYYAENIKEKRKTTEGEKKEGKIVWVCTVCGYEYEGDVLPADFICPICKHPASDFVKEIR